VLLLFVLVVLLFTQPSLETLKLESPLAFIFIAKLFKWNATMQMKKAKSLINTIKQRHK